MTALRYLQDLQADGLITALGLVNFDAVRTDEICTQLGPGAMVSNQVQVRPRISRVLTRALTEKKNTLVVAIVLTD